MAVAAERMLLVDNDAFVLLAGSGHLDLAASVLDLTVEECRYNGTLPYVFRKKIQPRVGPDVAQRVETALASAKALDLQPSPALQDQLLVQHDIDAGEAVLIGVLAEQDGWLLTTNDGRALRALARSEALQDVRRLVAGRIVTIESLLERLLQSHGIERLAAGFMEVAAYDKRLGVIFSDHNVANPMQCREAIESYLAATVRECGTELFYDCSRT